MKTSTIFSGLQVQDVDGPGAVDDDREEGEGDRKRRPKGHGNSLAERIVNR